MNNYEIFQLIDHLAACRAQGEHFAALEALEDYVDAEVDRQLGSLVGTAEAATTWGVSLRRAQAHVARLYEEGRPIRVIANTFFLTPAQVSEYRPGPGGRPRKGKTG